MKPFTSLFLLFFLFLSQLVQAQKSTLTNGLDGVKFKEGIYLTYADFINNKPSVAIEAIENLDSFKSFQKGSARIEAPRDIYYMENNEMKKVASNDIWGLCAFNTPYVFDQKNFYKLEIIGAVMKFYNTDHKKWDEKPGLPGQAVTSMKVAKYILFHDGLVVADKNAVEVAFSKDSEFFNQYQSSKGTDSSPTFDLQIMSFNQRHPVTIPAEL